MTITRRAIPSMLAAAALAPLSRPAQAQTVPVRVGFVPVIGASALFVIDRAGWAREAGLALATTKFDTGPAAIQAFASGSFDVLAIGVAPVALARAKGLDATIVSAAESGGSSFIVAPDLATRFAAAGNDPAKALAAFRAETGRRAKLATLPPGGVPTATLHHYLFAQNKTDRADVEIVSIGIEAVQQAMLAGAVDGATVLEPSATIVLARNPKLTTIVTALDMFPGVPGVVFSASRRFVGDHRAAIVAFVRLVARATTFIQQHPSEAAPYVAAVLGGGLIDPATMTRSMGSKAVAFMADPRTIIEPTKALLAYQATLGDFAQAPPIDGLFDLTVWDEAVKAESR